MKKQFLQIMLEQPMEKDAADKNDEDNDDDNKNDYDVDIDDKMKYLQFNISHKSSQIHENKFCNLSDKLELQHKISQFITKFATIHQHYNPSQLSLCSLSISVSSIANEAREKENE